MQTKQLIIGAVVLVVLGVGGTALLAKMGGGGTTAPGKYDAFAECLGEKGTKFYGAFWCPHCQNQKKLFGSSQSRLPYTECSLPNGKGQTQVCIDAKIESYPTWEFADGSRMAQEMTLAELAEKTTCELPAEA